MATASIQGRLPTIPEYFREFVNKDINLDETPKICCPFHKEDTPSFSYSRDKRVWRCFGSCKVGGDVVELHRVNYELGTRAEAEKSLKIMYGVSTKPKLESTNYELEVNDDKVDREVLYQRLCRLANNVERWLELDYVMSRYPVEVADMQQLLDSWLGVSRDDEEIEDNSESASDFGYEEYEY